MWTALRWPRWITVVLFVTAVPGATASQGEAQPRAEPAASAPASNDASARINLPSSVDLPRLLDLAADRLGLRLQYDPALLKGPPITLRMSGAGVSNAELWSLVQELLASQGLTTVNAGASGVLRVIKRADAADAAAIDAPPTPPNDAFSPFTSPAAATPGFRSVLIRPQHISPKDLAETVKPLLSRQGGSAAVLGTSGLVLISDTSSSIEQALRLIENIDSAERGVVVETAVVRHLSPQQIIALSTQIAAKREAAGGEKIPGDLIAPPGGDALLVVAPASRLPLWRALIAELDQREPVETRSYSPRSFALADVARLLEQTVKGGGGVGSGTSAGSAAGVNSGGGVGDDRFRIVIDDLTASLIITATPGQHERIELTLTRLDSVPASARRPVRTFKIRNRSVKEIQQVIENLLSTGVLQAQLDAGVSGAAGGDSGSGALSQPPIAAAGSQTLDRPIIPGGTPVPTLPGTEPGSPPSSAAPGGNSPGGAASTLSGAGSGPPASLGAYGRGPASNTASSISRGAGSSGLPPLVLTCDEPTSTLIAVGEPRALAQLEALLPTLDVRQPQVMLEAFLVSLSDSQSLDLGVELEKLQINGSTLFRLSSLFGLSTSSGSGTSANRTVGDLQGFTGVVLDPGDFAIVVHALEGINHGRSLSSPKVLVNNNQQATFNSVLQQPFASTNASTTVATTAFGGTQDAGTTISVKPQIAEGDHLVLNYSVSLSSFVGAASNPNLPPPRQQNSVQSTSTIPDGYTVVVGGLEVQTEGENVTQVPLLGSIPLFGELFKRTGKNTSRTRFFVFLRAGVMRSSTLEDLKYVSDRDSESAGLPDSWPTVQPRVIR